MFVSKNGRRWQVIAVIVATILGSGFGIWYARFVVRLGSRHRAAAVDEQAHAVQELLLASNPVSGMGGRWVLRRKQGLEPLPLDTTTQRITTAPEAPLQGGAGQARTPEAPAAPAAVAPVPASDSGAAFREPPSSMTSAAAAAAAAAESPPDGWVRLPVLEHTRRRVLAFQHAVMGGGKEGSLMPMDTQDVPCDQEQSMSDPSSLAKIGGLLLPFHHFSARYAIDVPADVAAWMEHTAAGQQPAELPAGAADVFGVWGAAFGGANGARARMTVQIASRAARATGGASAGAAAAARVRMPVDMDAHTKALARCILDNAPSAWYWHDMSRLHGAITREHRYPKLDPVFESGDAKAIALSIFREAKLQPVPQVLTLFNVVVTGVGYVFVPQGGDAAPRVKSGAGSNKFASFRPIMCLYREFDHSRGGNDATYTPPAGPVHDEVIVLSQFWGDAVFHVYQENFIRLASMLDYAVAHPHVKLHVMTPHSGPPHQLLVEVMQLFGIDPARAVYGSISAKIVHIPEGQPCGEPYAVSQVLLREVIRERLGLRAALDVWADGAALQHGLARETQTAAPGIQATSVGYSSSLHSCIQREYSLLAADPALRPAHPFARLLPSAIALEARVPLPPPPPGAAAPKPVVVLIERASSRNVPNGAALRDALAALPVTLRVFGADAPGSQADHLRLFSDADIVVGPHGAGLTNTVSAWPSTVVVEFIPESGLSNLVYMQSSLLLGFNFQSFTPPGSSYYGSISVDVQRVAEVVRAAATAQVPL